MQKQIIKRDYPIQSLANFSEIHPLLQRIYAARKINSSTQVDYALEKLLPFHTMLGLPEAVALLASALVEQQKILIVGDFDADGATSTAVAIRALQSFGAKQVEFLVPNRFEFGYGLTP